MNRAIMSRSRRAAGGFLLLWAALAGCGSGSGPALLLEAEVSPSPNSTLSAIVTVRTASVCQVGVTFGSGASETRRTGLTPPATAHRIEVVGLRAETRYRLQPAAYLGGGAVVPGEPLAFRTGSLPEGIPAWELTVGGAEPGAAATLFGPSPSPQDPGPAGPLYLGVDGAGEVVWYYQGCDGDALNDRDVKMLSDGNLLVQILNGFRVITVGGETVAEVTAEQAGVGDLHHDAIRLPEGRYAALTSETRIMSVPFSERPEEVRGDVILELDAQGRVLWRWSTFDHLDTSRFPTALSRQRHPDGTYDWTHSNAVVHVPEDDTLLLSMRHQNWVIKIDRSSGQIVWRLGPEGDFDLLNADPGDPWGWFYSQHAPELHPDGTFVLYDNGNDRPVDPESRSSRAVAYRLDEPRRTAQRLWTYRTDFFTGYLGDADLLDSANVLVCAGGQLEPGVPAQVVEAAGDASAGEVWKLQVYDRDIYRATRLTSFWPDADG